MFSNYGTITSVKVFSENGYGFVCFSDSKSAMDAIQALNGYDLNGGY